VPEITPNMEIIIGGQLVPVADVAHWMNADCKQGQKLFKQLQDFYGVRPTMLRPGLVQRGYDVGPRRCEYHGRQAQGPGRVAPRLRGYPNRPLLLGHGASTRVHPFGHALEAVSALTARVCAEGPPAGLPSSAHPRPGRVKGHLLRIAHRLSVESTGRVCAKVPPPTAGSNTGCRLACLPGSGTRRWATMTTGLD